LSIKSLGGHGFQVYKHVILPAILPNLFTSIRVSIGISISVLFFAENYATNLGIGYFIMDSWLKLDYTAMFSGIVLISLMGTFLFNIIDILERKICVWN
jgi:NitT/TauT family transport system permease protein